MKVKDFFLRFNNEYSKTFQKSRIISQIPLYTIAVITLCEIGWTIYLTSQVDNIHAELWESIKESLTFLSLVAAMFLGRFLLMFSASKIAFWFSQVIWLISLITLHSFTADLSQGGCTKNMFPMAGQTLSIIYALYMLGSPLHQIALLLFSLNKVFSK